MDLPVKMSKFGKSNEIAGLSQGHFSHIERGETEMGAAILLKIGREFGKSIEWLLTGEDQKSTGEEQ